VPRGIPAKSKGWVAFRGEIPAPMGAFCRGGGGVFAPLCWDFRPPSPQPSRTPKRTFAGRVNVSARTGNIRCPPEVEAHLLAGPVFGYLNPGNRLMPYSPHRALFPISGISMSEPYLLTRAPTSRSRQRLQLSQNTRSSLSFAMRFARVAGLRTNVFP
jgi:hypothetical protein